jgi:hypothetical protein
MRGQSVREDLLLSLDTSKFFTEPHYNGYPAVLVRLPAVDVQELEVLITDAWRYQAPKALVRQFAGTERMPSPSEQGEKPSDTRRKR